MKQKFTLLLFLFIAGIGVLEVPAQSLVLKTKDGTEQSKQLSTLKKLTFSNNNLVINYVSGENETYSVPTISKLYFNTVSTGFENITLNSGTMSIYPNPVDNTVYIQNLPEITSTVSIYFMNGVMVFHTQISSGTKSIDVSFLRSGLYLLKINNQAFKFVKK